MLLALLEPAAAHRPAELLPGWYGMHQASPLHVAELCQGVREVESANQNHLAKTCTDDIPHQHLLHQ